MPCSPLDSASADLQTLPRSSTHHAGHKQQIWEAAAIAICPVCGLQWFLAAQLQCQDPEYEVSNIASSATSGSAPAASWLLVPLAIAVEPMGSLAVATRLLPLPLLQLQPQLGYSTRMHPTAWLTARQSGPGPRPQFSMQQMHCSTLPRNNRDLNSPPVPRRRLLLPHLQLCLQPGTSHHGLDPHGDHLRRHLYQRPLTQHTVVLSIVAWVVLEDCPQGGEVSPLQFPAGSGAPPCQKAGQALPGCQAS